MIAVLLDPPLPRQRQLPLFASEAELRRALTSRPQRHMAAHVTSHVLELLRRVNLDVASVAPNHLNQQFSRLFHDLDATLAFKVREEWQQCEVFSDRLLRSPSKLAMMPSLHFSILPLRSSRRLALSNQPTARLW